MLPLDAYHISKPRNVHVQTPGKELIQSAPAGKKATFFS